MIILKDDYLNHYKNLRIKTEDIHLRELEKTDFSIILDIVEEYTVVSTFILYALFLKYGEKLTNGINDYDKTLEVLLPKFEETKKSLPRINYENIKQKINKTTVCEYIKINIPIDIRFSPYGPIQKEPLSDQIYNKSINYFIQKSLISQMDTNRKLFRLGIVNNENDLIGCISFDFYEIKIDNYVTIGDFGIFIHPNKRETNDGKGRIWEDVLFILTRILKQIVNKEITNNLFISATTHPFNWSTDNMLKPFMYCGTKNTEYGIRKQYVISYNDFIDYFEKKQKTNGT